MSAAERLKVTFATRKVERLMRGGSRTPVVETISVDAQMLSTRDHATLDDLQRFIDVARQAGAPGDTEVAASGGNVGLPHLSGLQLQFTASTLTPKEA